MVDGGHEGFFPTGMWTLAARGKLYQPPMAFGILRCGGARHSVCAVGVRVRGTGAHGVTRPTRIGICTCKLHWVSVLLDSPTWGCASRRFTRRCPIADVKPLYQFGMMIGRNSGAAAPPYLMKVGTRCCASIPELPIFTRNWYYLPKLFKVASMVSNSVFEMFGAAFWSI